MSLYVWLHRKGIARLLNSGSNLGGCEASSYIEARGPRRLAEQFARYALRHNPVVCPPDWATLRVTKAQRVSRTCWRFMFEYRRLAA